MGARRRRKNERLPKYVYEGKVKYVYRPYFNGKRGKEIPLCPLTATTLEIWQAFEDYTGSLQKPKETLSWLCEQYLASDKFKSLSKYTHKEYSLYHKRIVNKKLKDGTLFGDNLLEDITSGAIRAYLDSRIDAPVTANREVAFLGAVYKWGYQRDLCSFNPVTGVEKYTEKTRELYVTDEMYQQFYDIAVSPWYIRPMMEIAYLCRMRRVEILDLKLSDIKDEGLLTRRKKGSKTTITEWTPRLRDAIDVCRKRKTFYLFADKKGNPINDGTFTTYWGSLWRKKAKSERFTFHDLKAKGVSDFEGDKQLASGHKTASMVAVYDRKLKQVEATK